jgi:hypothetical protein
VFPNYARHRDTAWASQRCHRQRARPVGQAEATSGAPTANIYDFADGKIERVRVILDREEARELAARP